MYGSTLNHTASQSISENININKLSETDHILSIYAIYNVLYNSETYIMIPWKLHQNVMFA